MTQSCINPVMPCAGIVANFFFKYSKCEEIGLRPGAVEPLISFFLSPGLLDEKIHLFYAPLENCEGLLNVGGNPDEQENLLIKGFRPEELVSMISRGEIVDAKTIAAVLYYLSLQGS